MKNRVQKNVEKSAGAPKIKIINEIVQQDIDR